jgi:hypothetical protein
MNAAAGRHPPALIMGNQAVAAVVGNHFLAAIVVVGAAEVAALPEPAGQGTIVG